MHPGPMGALRLPTYRTNTLAKSRASGEHKQDVDATLERLHRLAVFSSEFAHALCLFLKHGGHGLDRVARFELFGKRVFDKFCAGLLFIVLQSRVEEGLKVRGPGRETHVASRRDERWGWKKRSWLRCCTATVYWCCICSQTGRGCRRIVTA